MPSLDEMQVDLPHPVFYEHGLSISVETVGVGNEMDHLGALMGKVGRPGRRIAVERQAYGDDEAGVPCS